MDFSMEGQRIFRSYDSFSVVLVRYVQVSAVISDLFHVHEGDLCKN